MAGSDEDATVEISINWAATRTAYQFIERVRDTSTSDPDVVLRTIGGLMVSKQGENEGWMAQLKAADLQRMMDFRLAWAGDPERSVAAAPLVSEIIAAGPLVTKLVFQQLMALHRATD